MEPIPIDDSWNLFIIENNGQNIEIRVGGESIGFEAFDELEAYTGVSLSGLEYLSYEPEIFRFLIPSAGVEIDFAADAFSGVDRSAEFTEGIQVYQPLIGQLDALFTGFNDLKAFVQSEVQPE